jgi:gas vesicle protein
MKPRDLTDWFFDVVPFQRKSSTDWILPSAVGLGLGVAAGIGIGMLLAPQSGTETREKLREGAENLKDKARDLADRAKGQLSHATQQLGNGLATGYSNEMHQGR